MPQVPEVKFFWKDQRHEFHRPVNMTTHHLFYTLRMIWNHTVEPKYQLTPFKQYRFSDYYTKEYMRQAISALLVELKGRPDIEPEWYVQLAKMASHINNSRGEIT